MVNSVDQSGRHSEVEPFLDAAKSFTTSRKIAAKLISAVAMTFVIGCSSKEKAPEESATTPETAEVKPTPTPVAAKEEPVGPPTDWSKAITKIGKNEKPAFSSDGKRMLFISRERPAHKHRQLYEMNLETKQERRLTYQDGEVFEGTLSPDDQTVFYTSTTDEIKERPILFYPELKSEPFPMTEIYRIKPKEDLHERWTTRPGFDGFIHTHTEPGKGLTVTQSRWIGSDLQLYRSYGQKPGFEDMGAKKAGVWSHSYTTHTKKPWKAWVQENSITGATSIVVQKPGAPREIIFVPTFEIRDLQFMDSGSNDMTEFIYTGKSEKMGTRKAFWLNASAKCQKPFLSSSAEVAGLQVTPDGRSLAWTLAQGSESQIFMGPIDKGPATCEPLSEAKDKSLAAIPQ